MTEFEDARWRRLIVERALEADLAAEDDDFIDRYTPAGPADRAEDELLGALQGLGRGSQDEREDAAHIEAALAAYLGPEGDAQRRRWPWAVAAAGVLAAVATAWIIGGGLDHTPEPGAEDAEVAAASRDGKGGADGGLHDRARAGAAAEGDGGAGAEGGAKAGAEGGAVAEGGGAAEGGLDPGAASDRPSPAGEVLEVAEERSCLTLSDVNACFEPGSRVVVDAASRTLDITKGEANIEVTKPLAESVSIKVAGDRYEVEAPVTLTIEVHQASAVKVEVTQGSAIAIDDTGRRTVLHAKTRPAARSIPDAKTLLRTARAARASGDRPAAIRAYLDLVTHHPREPAAAPAKVTLGELYLSRGKPRQALKWFDRYLAGRHKTLAEEAHYGRIKALRAMGRRDAARKAAAAFVQRFPSSSYASKLK